MSAAAARRPADLAAALAALSAAELVAAAAGRPGPVDGVARAVVDSTPRSVVDLAVRLLGAADKPVARAGVVAAVGAAGVLAGRLDGGARRLGVLGVAATGAVLASRRRPHRPVSTAVAAGAGAAVGIGLLERSTPARPVFALAALATAATGTLRVARARRHHRDRPPLPVPGGPLPPAVDGAERWTGVSPLHTPLDRFYATDVAVGRPRIDPGRWRLSVDGLVRRPLDLDIAGLAALGPVELDAVLVCIHNPAGGDRVGNGRWTGVPVPKLLAAAELMPEATHLVTRSDDGFTITLPLPLVTADPPALVALGLGGEPLTAAHGFPARVLTPGLYGQYGGVKWVTGLSLVRDPAADYWVRRGWPADPAPVRPGARIDSPRPGRLAGSPAELTGVAWAPPHGLAAVEVTVDGGTPRAAELAAELGPAAWRRWRLPGVELGPGDHRLAARAVPRGPAPADVQHRPYPSGQTGVHEIIVRRPSTSPSG